MNKIFKTFAIGFITIAGAMTLVGCGGEKNIESSSSEISTIFIIETAIETTTETTTEITETSSETTIVPTVETLEDAIAALERDLGITEKGPKIAELIGAKGGYSFFCNGLIFELYIYDDGANELEDAADGSLSYELYKGCTVEMNTYVNKNFVLVYYEEDAAVINVFLAL